MTDDCVNTKKFPANQEIDWENDAKYSSLTDDNELKVFPSNSANGSPKTVGDSDDEDYLCFIWFCIKVYSKWFYTAPKRVPKGLLQCLACKHRRILFFLYRTIYNIFSINLKNYAKNHLSTKWFYIELMVLKKCQSH